TFRPACILLDKQSAFCLSRALQKTPGLPPRYRVSSPRAFSGAVMANEGGCSMSRAVRLMVVAGAILLITAASASLRTASPQAQQPVAPTGSSPTSSFDSTITQNAQRMIEEGRKIFRFDTFGDEAFWGDQLKLHQAIVGQKLGGVGPGLS